ncbi:Transcription factor, fungi [Metarhizium guizhouense ARSEF 977]|uniref:Transcription factor, fungi n=1 Tax=Metarhizium guizhouense (strain ARSEF 977) TaxID=1276136 RepID=A0A0B4GWY0_METGA|nr:Transcription factor, fungi [Metarhizium guizhouense ARSEF 977]
MLNFKDTLADGLDPETPALKECTDLALCDVCLPMNQREELPTDESLPTAPPSAILNAMIEPYFAAVNPHFPIWTKQQIQEMAATLEQSTSPERDAATMICCNNLILMTLTANSLRSRWGKPLQTKHRRRHLSVDSDITAGFLMNAKRAIKHVELLLSPCLVNVQALLSLCMVAQEHLSSYLVEAIFSLAAQCAKSTGIHQWESFRGHFSEQAAQERRNVSYCLYILDKTVCWTTGTSPSIPASDLLLDFTLAPDDDGTMAYLFARTELAVIEEMIYSRVYSNQVEVRTEDQVRQIAAKISQRLQDWLVSWRIHLNEVESHQKQAVWKAKLAVDFLCVQLLLIWPYKDHPDALFQQQTHIARRCMRLFLHLWQSTQERGHHVAIARSVVYTTRFPRRFLVLVTNWFNWKNNANFCKFSRSLAASHPPLYLHAMYMQGVGVRGQEFDQDLLRDYTEMLEVITDSQGENCYNRRLCQISRFLMRVQTTQNTPNKRQKLNPRATSATSIPSPQSGSSLSNGSPIQVHSPGRTPRVMALERHNPESDISAAGLDDSLNLSSPSEQSNMGQSQLLADELETATSYTSDFLGQYDAVDFESRAADEEFGVCDNLWLQQGGLGQPSTSPPARYAVGADWGMTEFPRFRR